MTRPLAGTNVVDWRPTKFALTGEEVAKGNLLGDLLSHVIDRIAKQPEVRLDVRLFLSFD